MKVIISKPVRSAMQSGKKNTKHWLVETAEENNSRSLNSLMHWTSSNNTSTQLKFYFSNKEEAIKFAQSQGFQYEIEEPKTTSVKRKSYAENFTN